MNKQVILHDFAKELTFYGHIYVRMKCVIIGLYFGVDYEELVDYEKYEEAGNLTQFDVTDLQCTEVVLTLA